MCGRFASALPPDEMLRVFVSVGEVPNQPPSWNVAPTQTALVIRRHPDVGQRRLDSLVWGLISSFEKDPKGGRKPINARSETIATSGLFRGAFQTRGCLVLMDTFYDGRRHRPGSSSMRSPALTVRRSLWLVSGGGGARRTAKSAAPHHRDHGSKSVHEPDP